MQHHRHCSKAAAKQQQSSSKAAVKQQQKAVLMHHPRHCQLREPELCLVKLDVPHHRCLQASRRTQRQLASIEIKKKNDVLHHR
jgi:hypothetical protein